MCGSKIYFDTAFKSPLLEGHELIAIDLPGFGGSFSSEIININLMIKAVEAVITFYSVKNPWIIAHSMASLISFRLINKIDGVILLEGNLLPEHLSFSSKIIQIERKKYNDVYDRLKNLADIVMRQQVYIKELSLVKYYASSYSMCNSNTVWDSALMCVEEIHNLNIKSILFRYKKPVTLIYGLNSEYARTIQIIKDKYKMIDFFSIDNCGHFPMIDNPESVWKTVASQIRK